MKLIEQKLTAKQIIAAFAALYCFSVYGFSQIFRDDEAVRQVLQEENNKVEQERDLAQRRASLDNLSVNKTLNVTTFKRASLSRNEKERRKKIVAIDATDLELSRDFLKQPNTGVFRIFPENICITNGVMELNGFCNNIFPGTWFYSFRERDYSDITFFDILLRKDKLITDGFMSQGILANLGNVSLDNVNLESTSTKYLVDFKPAVNYQDIKIQYEQIDKGIEANGYKYSKEVTAQVGNVYLLRVIAYRPQQKFLNKILKKPQAEINTKFLLLDQDERVDMIAAFRIVRKSPAGNLTIIWKELSRKKSLAAIFEEH